MVVIDSTGRLGSAPTTTSGTATSENTPNTVVQRDATGSFAAGTITATAFSGSGANLTSLNAANITSNILAPARGGTGVAGCSIGQLLKWNGTAWVCDADAVGSGGGASLGSNTFTGTQTIDGGNLDLDPSTATTGNITKNGARFLHNFGSGNTFLGAGAGNLTMTGDSNIGLGVSALANNATGVSNTATGNVALLSNTSGFGNTATGNSALRFNTEGVSNTASGASALRSNTLGSNNAATGVNALFNNTSGSGNVAVGTSALFDNVTGSFNTAIGQDADVAAGALTNATAIGHQAVVDASNKIRLGNARVTTIEGNVAYTFTSDRNKKEHFHPVNGADVVRKMLDLNVSSWNYIGQDAAQFRHYGPVAQEFFEAFGNDGIGVVGTPTTINSGDMAGILMIAVQELAKQNAEMKARLAALEQLITDRNQSARTSDVSVDAEGRLTKVGDVR
jgi:hypothetical protein